MNKDQIKGRTESAKGKVKEVTGKAVGNKNLENRGKVDQVRGKIQKNYGDVKDDVRRSAK